MSPTVISVRTDADIKEQARQVFEDLGLDMSSAINLFLRQVIVDNGIPFTPKRENPLNVLARAQADARIGKTYDSFEDFVRDIENDS